MNSEIAIDQIKRGLKIGKENKFIDWGKSFTELINDVEIFNIDENGRHYIFFGEKEIFPNIILGLYTPFDNCHENFNDTTLNHVGQNLNLKDIEILIEKLISLFGNPIEKDDSYGIYRKWRINDITIEIIPRSHHGSDWNAIIIKKESCL